MNITNKMDDVFYACVPMLGWSTEIRLEKTTEDFTERVEYAGIFIKVNDSHNNKNTFWNLANQVENGIYRLASSCVVKCRHVPVEVLHHGQCYFDCYFVRDDYGPSLYMVECDTSDVYQMTDR